MLKRLAGLIFTRCAKCCPYCLAGRPCACLALDGLGTCRMSRVGWPKCKYFSSCQPLAPSTHSQLLDAAHLALIKDNGDACTPASNKQAQVRDPSPVVQKRLDRTLLLNVQPGTHHASACSVAQPTVGMLPSLDCSLPPSRANWRHVCSQLLGQELLQCTIDCAGLTSSLLATYHYLGRPHPPHLLLPVPR